MKPKLYKIPFAPDASFLYKQIKKSFINDPWHFHKEYELIAIHKGKGTKFIGDNVSLFEEGDLSLIGSNIPHLYRNNQDFYDASHNLSTELSYIHFTKEFLGRQFFEIPEMTQTNRLLEKSALALEIHGKTRETVISLMIKMNEQSPARRLISLLEILEELSQSKDLKPLLSSGYTANTSGSTDKINLVFEFILKNYTKEIYVQDIAEKLNISVPAFSRYFKNHTRKTFSDYVTEIRIGHACRLLMENNHTISEISYQSGFDNLSNFYRHFKKILGVIPKDYRNRFLKTTAPVSMPESSQLHFKAS